LDDIERLVTEPVLQNFTDSAKFISPSPLDEVTIRMKDTDVRILHTTRPVGNMKWMQGLGELTGIIYVIPIDLYNQRNINGDSVLNDYFSTFAKIAANQVFRNLPVAVAFTNQEALSSILKREPVSNYFSDYQGK
jgi:hypothetical protein